MLGRFFLCAFLFYLAFAEVNAQDILPTLIRNQQAKDAMVIEARVNIFIADLNKKRRSRSEQEFLRLIFNEAHRKFFKTYKPYTQLPELVERGQYDCLSATSLLAVVLNSFGYDFHLIETNYHIFISVQTTSGTVLLETTDRLNGFVAAPDKIQQRISSYKANQLQANDSDRVQYQFDFNLYQVIQPQQLSGLLLFNQAVVAFNNQQYHTSAQRLKEAAQIYDSPRTPAFAAILITAISNSDISFETKKKT